MNLRRIADAEQGPVERHGVAGAQRADLGVGEGGGEAMVGHALRSVRGEEILALAIRSPFASSRLLTPSPASERGF